MYLKQIEFGMPALSELPDMMAHAALCAKLGLSFIELNMNFPMFQMHELDIHSCRRIQQETGVGFTLHLDENLDVCSFNRLTARAWRDTVLQTIVLAKQLHIPIINMHLPDGVYITLPEKRLFLYAQYRDHYLTNIRTFRDLCTQAIGSDNTRICIENSGPFRDFHCEAIDVLLQSACFGLTYDTGHDHIIQYTNEVFIFSRSEHVHHMHLHDAKDGHPHLPLGEGEINIRRMLDTAHACGVRCVVETKTVQALTESVTFLRNIYTTTDDSSDAKRMNI